jgi:predicted metalloprotease with PDZ domain
MNRVLIAVMLLVLLAPVAEAIAGQGRGYIGVTVVGVDSKDEAAERRGVFIDTVHVGSGAEAAGLLEDDRILTLNGIAIEDVDDMDIVLDATRPGETLQVGVLRDGTEQNYEVVLGGKPATAGTVLMHHFSSDGGKWVIEMAGQGPRMGANLQPLSAQLADYFGVPSGLLVTEVVEGGAAWEAGLAAGDVLLDIDGQDVGHQKGVQEVLTRHEAGDVVDVTVQRRGRTERYSLTLQEGPRPRTGEMTFNIALDGSGKNEFELQKQIQLAVSESDDNDWTAGEPITIRLTTEDDTESLRTRIEKLKQELRDLEEQLRQHEND